MCSPRRPHKGQPLSDAVCKRKKMASDVEISFVDESDFIKQENWYFWRACRILVKNLSPLVIFLCTMIHVATVLEPSTSAGSRRGKRSTKESSVAKLSRSLTTSDRGWTLKRQYHEIPRAALFTVLAPEFRTYHC